MQLSLNIECPITEAILAMNGRFNAHNVQSKTGERMHKIVDVIRDLYALGDLVMHKIYEGDRDPASKNYRGYAADWEVVSGPNK